MLMRVDVPKVVH